jgi:hypothetical protein
MTHLSMGNELLLCDLHVHLAIRLFLHHHLVEVTREKGHTGGESVGERGGVRI